MAFNPVAAFAALSVLFIPGIAFSFALLRSTTFGRFDKTLLGLILGMLSIPLLSFFEYFFLGVKLNALLVLANALLVLFASLLSLHFQGATFRPSIPRFEEKNWKQYAVLVLVALSILLG